MGKVLTCLIVAMVCIRVAEAGRGGATRFIYVSPFPGSSLVSPQTNVILRSGVLLDPSVVNDPSVLTVTGTKSGSHTGRLILADDARTLLFLPDRSFAGDEVVTVEVSHPVHTAPGGNLDPISFRFTTSAKVPSPLRRPSILDELRDLPVPRAPGTFSGAGDLGQALDSLPGDFPAIRVTVQNKNPMPAAIYLSNFTFDGTVPNTPYLMIVDENGVPSYYSRKSGQCLDFKKQSNGLITYYDGTLGYFVAIDGTHSVVDTYACGNGYTTDDHELRILPDGHALLLSYDSEQIEMDTIVPGGARSAEVLGLIIQELDRSKNVVFQWRSWDHFKITDVVGADLTSTFIDYVHGNALELDADSNIVLSSRHMDEITKINRQTGDIMWRWGGKHNEFTFVNDTLGFSHQHAIRRLPNGNFTLFDNGNFHAPPFSRAVEYSLDEQNKVAMLVWQYRHTPDVFGGAMGYVQRLDDGSTLIGWGAANPTVTEVTPDGEVLFELSYPFGVFSYRAYMFAPDTTTAGVFAGRETPSEFVLAQNYPNPFNPKTVVSYQLPEASAVRLVVYDMLGREVEPLVNETQAAGNYKVGFDASALSSGVYLYQLTAGRFVEARKMLLLR